MQPMLLFTELLLLAYSSALLLNKKYLLGGKPRKILIENQVNENNFNHNKIIASNSKLYTKYIGLVNSQCDVK